MVLACDTSSCYDDLLCQIIFKSQDAGQSYEVDPILEHINHKTQKHTHTHTHTDSFIPSQGGSILSMTLVGPVASEELFENADGLWTEEGWMKKACLYCKLTYEPKG